MRWYYRKLSDSIVLIQSRPEFADQLAYLQRTCFPTLADEERFKSEHYLQHTGLFEDGQAAVLDGDRVIGATTTRRPDFDLEIPKSILPASNLEAFNGN